MLEQWDTIFTPAFVDEYRQDLPHDMFVHDGMAMLGSGEAWFDGKGLAVVNFPKASPIACDKLVPPDCVGLPFPQLSAVGGSI